MQNEERASLGTYHLRGGVDGGLGSELGFGALDGGLCGAVEELGLRGAIINGRKRARLGWKQ
jgi:hypothetical protein